MQNSEGRTVLDDFTSNSAADAVNIPCQEYTGQEKATTAQMHAEYKL
jgi:hypothetical protein